MWSPGGSCEVGLKLQYPFAPAITVVSISFDSIVILTLWFGIAVPENIGLASIKEAFSRGLIILISPYFIAAGGA